MNTLNERKNLIKKHTPKSSFIMNGVRAFLFGGLICAIGEIIFIIINFRLDEDFSYIAVSYIFIAVSAILTGFGVFDKIARFAGAGTIVPVTGFSNSVTSSAIDSKSEGYVLGVGAKIFTVAGPVILYGMLSGSLYGFIFYIYKILL